LKAQREFDVIADWNQFSDAHNSLYHHLAKQAFDLLDKRSDKIAGLHSLSDWQKRQQMLKQTFSDIIGPFPEKNPLNAKVLRVIEKDFYKVEHIVYESQPGVLCYILYVYTGCIKKKRKGTRCDLLQWSYQ
jgi:hypothetical protein